MASAKRPASSAVTRLRHAREVLQEFRKTLEPLFPIADMVIVRGLLIILLLEKAWQVIR